MDMRHQIFADLTNNPPLPDYSLLELAGSFATLLTMLVIPLLILVGGAFSIGAAMAYALTLEKKFLPTAIAPLAVGGLLYGVLLAGGLTSLGLWCGLGLLAASYPFLKRIARRRVERKLAARS